MLAEPSAVLAGFGEEAGLDDFPARMDSAMEVLQNNFLVSLEDLLIWQGVQAVVAVRECLK